MRIKSPLLKGRPDSVTALLEIVKRHAGVGECTFNGVTGSLLVFFDPNVVSADEMLNSLQGNGYELDTTTTQTEPRLPDKPKVERKNYRHIIAGALASALLEKLLERSATALIKAVFWRYPADLAVLTTVPSRFSFVFRIRMSSASLVIPNNARDLRH